MARNNATWCDAVCRSNGRVPRFTSRWWCHDGPGLAFYPNLVTLDPAVTTAEVATWIASLGATAGLGEFGIKDSFARLDLAPLGLNLLFEGQWIHRAPQPDADPPGTLHWQVVDSDALRAHWQSAWWRAAGEPADEMPLARPSLLRSDGISLLAGCAGDEVVAGCALTVSDDVVGMTCNFHGGLDPLATLRETVAEIHRRHPGRAIVGYEAGDDLLRAQACGFTCTGPLRVWLHTAARGPSS